MSFNCCRSTYTRIFFNKYTIYICDPRLVEFSDVEPADTKGQPWDLSIWAFWYQRQVLEPIPSGYRGRTTVLFGMIYSQWTKNSPSRKPAIYSIIHSSVLFNYENLLSPSPFGNRDDFLSLSSDIFPGLLISERLQSEFQDHMGNSSHPRILSEPRNVSSAIL